MIEIKSWLDGQVLFSGKHTTIKDAIEAAIRSSADLRFADLRSAKLRSADLRYANLRSANLRFANLRSADLRSADLSYAKLRSANLRYANLRYAKIAFQSHEVLSEILKRAAGDDTEKLKIAGYILVCRNKCWQDFGKLAKRDPLGDWALDELATWVQEGDCAPDMLRQRKAANEAALSAFQETQNG